MSSESRRVRLDLAYDGTHFHGWAVQPGLRTVAGEVEGALGTVFQRSLPLTVAGRTDAGVHATAQVAATDIPAGHPATGDLAHLTERLNRLLAARFARDVTRRAPRGVSDVVIQKMGFVPDAFDARFSALERRYRYRIADQLSGRDPLRRLDRWWLPYPELDLSAMGKGAKLLLGTHDFLSFCRPREGASTIRSLKRVSVRRDRGEVLVDLAADAFCHSMVRSLVGALVEVGRGNRGTDWVEALIEEPSRRHGVPVAPAAGLTLVGVDYPADDELSAVAQSSRRLRGVGDLAFSEDSGTLSPRL